MATLLGLKGVQECQHPLYTFRWGQRCIRSTHLRPKKIECKVFESRFSFRIISFANLGTITYIVKLIMWTSNVKTQIQEDIKKSSESGKIVNFCTGTVWLWILNFSSIWLHQIINSQKYITTGPANYELLYCETIKSSIMIINLVLRLQPNITSQKLITKKPTSPSLDATRPSRCCCALNLLKRGCHWNYQNDLVSGFCNCQN